MTEEEYKAFKVMQSIATARIGEQKVHWNSEDLFNKIRKPGLEDAAALLRAFEAQIKEHNARLDADITRIGNLDYMNRKAWESKYFHSISRVRVMKLVKEFPALESWEIARMYK